MSRSRNRLAIVRQGHEIAKPPSLIVDWNVAPEAGPKYYGDHLAPALLGSSERALHFLLGAVIGVDEVGADQENYQLGRGEFGLDCPVEMLTRAEAISPRPGPTPCATAEESERILAWLELPEVRLVECPDGWAFPTGSAARYAPLLNKVETARNPAAKTVE